VWRAPTYPKRIMRDQADGEALAVAQGVLSSGGLTFGWVVVRWLDEDVERWFAVAVAAGVVGGHGQLSVTKEPC